MRLCRNLLGTAAIALALAACSAVPGSGPRTSDIERETPAYTLVDLNADSARTISDFVVAHSAQGSINLPPNSGQLVNAARHFKCIRGSATMVFFGD